MISTTKIVKKLEKHSDSIRVVSFDIFDTLLDRRIPDAYVSHIAADILAKQYPNTANAEQILQSRTRYRLAHEKSGTPWLLSAWLAHWANENGLSGSLVIEAGCQAELSAECAGLDLADGAPGLLRYIKSSGYTVIATSDMWLDSDWLNKLLVSFGLVFDRVYSSGTVKKNKRRGDIFAFIENDISRPAKAFLHIGDNVLNDVIRPRQAGWESLWMPQK
uniref:FMN phosphatase YigB, HAD superfamily n=1 Tax=Candidatus Kentrum sp. UNK TaxID=2126344 RepID=A0A451AJQ2_9GAMM|nr:MAG: FMN phosphatase YigB, HAD superfamily [Candidatus Kentron sp. UNK]VFK71897.1 MAG: FMN phosphatase YigB, HAD superfamily [Candidatus Kentron sp. UNK]